MKGMFSKCFSLTSLNLFNFNNNMLKICVIWFNDYSLNLFNFNNNVKDMYYMFNE